jgi:hypothetical protein
MRGDDMSRTDPPQPPLSPDPPAPQDPEAQAPDLPSAPPEDREAPDGTGVSSHAGTVEAPD